MKLHKKLTAYNLRVLGIFVAIGILAAVVITTYPKPSPPVKPKPQSQQIRQNDGQPFRASFAIFTNGTVREFSDPKYHRKSGDIYIDAKSPHSIQMKESGKVWSDFFNTLPMQLTDTCLITGTEQQFCTNATHSLKFFINGKEVPAALENEIITGDKLLVSYGPKNDPAVSGQLSKVPDP